jgi:hypothetical protein
MLSRWFRNKSKTMNRYPKRNKNLIVECLEDRCVPSAVISGPSTTSEGSIYTLNLDSGGTQAADWTINWGDGTTPQVVSGNPSSTNHVYADGPNAFSISATMSDGTNSETSNTIPLEVLNVPPTLTISGASSVNQGALYTLNLASSDPGEDTISSWTINWGDGSAPQMTTTTPAPSAFYHVYPAIGTVSVAVNTVAPIDVNIAGGPYSTNEGQSLTLNAMAANVLNDANGFEAPAFSPGALAGQNGWTNAGADGAFNVESTYAASGAQAVQANSGNSSVAYAFPIVEYTPAADEQVELDVDIARTASSTTDYTQNSPVYAVDVFNEDFDRTTRFGLYSDITDTVDPGAIKAFVSIPVPTSVNVTGNMVLPLGNVVSADQFVHFKAVLDYTAQTVTLTVDGTTYGAFSFVNPSSTLVTAALQVGSFPQSTDTGYFDNYKVNVLSPASDAGNSGLSYSWDINGDGVYGDATGANPTLTWAQLNALGINDGPATRNVSVQVSDGLGDVVTSNPVTLTVNNTAPTLTISGASSVSQGALYTLNLASSDPGDDTISSWTINWGDGSPIQTVAGNPSSVTHVFANNLTTCTISASATDEDGTYAAGNTVTVAVVVNSAPAAITSVVINQDISALYNAAGQPFAGAQRSMVDDIVYTFSEPVNILDPGTDPNVFTVTVAAGWTGTVPTLSWAPVVGSNNTQWAVTFSGNGVTGGSIANGAYAITVTDPASIMAVSDGQTLSLDASGIGGATQSFYRLYGDINGDEVVNAADNLKFKQALTTYNAAFDYSDDGTVNASDNLKFKDDLTVNFSGFTATI